MLPCPVCLRARQALYQPSYIPMPLVFIALDFDHDVLQGPHKALTCYTDPTHSSSFYVSENFIPRSSSQAFFFLLLQAVQCCFTIKSKQLISLGAPSAGTGSPTLLFSFVYIMCKYWKKMLDFFLYFSLPKTRSLTKPVTYLASKLQESSSLPSQC